MFPSVNEPSYFLDAASDDEEDDYTTGPFAQEETGTHLGETSDGPRPQQAFGCSVMKTKVSVVIKVGKSVSSEATIDAMTLTGDADAKLFIKSIKLNKAYIPKKYDMPLLVTASGFENEYMFKDGNVKGTATFTLYGEGKRQKAVNTDIYDSLRQGFATFVNAEKTVDQLFGSDGEVLMVKEEPRVWRGRRIHGLMVGMQHVLPQELREKIRQTRGTSEFLDLNPDEIKTARNALTEAEKRHALVDKIKLTIHPHNNATLKECIASLMPEDHQDTNGSIVLDLTVKCIPHRFEQSQAPMSCEKRV